MKKILVVDDEVQILKSMSRLFIDTEYEVIIAESGEEALTILKEEPINLIMSDMRMPQMDGYELLTQVKKNYPKIARMILSGYSDEKTVFKALQKNIAKLYLFKPWKNEQLLQIIKQVFETQDVLSGSELLKFMNDMETLPTIKMNYKKIIQLIEDDVDLSLLTAEIEQDISIATQIIRIANSAYFGAKTGSIKQAIHYIGLNNLKNLVLSTSVVDMMEHFGNSTGYVQNIWKHSFLSNRLLAFLYEKHLKSKLPENYSTAGLLMNIGTVFILSCYKDQYLSLIVKSRNQKQSMIVLEKEIFGVNHCEAGGYLLEWWDFPYPIIEVALYHHCPMDERVVNRELLCASHIVAKYAMELLGKEWTGGLDMRAFEFLGIAKEKFEESLLDFKL